ncbi:MAG: sugar phosphate isomerase/epimerase [Victivallales bacterium]|nr:sugar phosphate isomerase/epimerase [Victivallales bacterium]MBT7167021.1 sugar phosphate isomerase/epimerase [Victivallales bacterium]
MANLKIGVMVDSFGLAIPDGVRKAKDVGADGMQVYVVEGDMAAEALDATRRNEFKALVDSQGLEIAALCGDLGGHGFQVAAENAEKIRRSKAIVDLAVDLGTRVVTTHIGVVPEDTSDEIYQNQLAACKELGAYAAERGVTFAIETGPEPATRLKSFLDDVASPGFGVNLDPANLIMVLNDDPVAAVYTLREYIVHTHAKDGVQYKPCDPVQVYASFAEGGIEGLNIGELFNELPLGEGAVDWDNYLKALVEIGYEGYLTIEREVGDDPAADIRLAVSFLRSKIDQ